MGENGEGDAVSLSIPLQAVAYVPAYASAACFEPSARVMSGDSGTLSWKGVPAAGLSASTEVYRLLPANVHPATKEGTCPGKIIKVCFLSNSSNLGKNFKLVRCEEGWTVGVTTVFFGIISTCA